MLLGALTLSVDEGAYTGGQYTTPEERRRMLLAAASLLSFVFTT